MGGSFLLFGRSLKKILSPFNLFGGDITRKYIYIDISSQELSYQNGCQKTFKCIIPILVESIPIFSWVQGSEEMLEKLKRIPNLQHLCFFMVFFHRFWYQSINKHIPYSRVSFFLLEFEEKCKMKRWGPSDDSISPMRKFFFTLLFYFVPFSSEMDEESEKSNRNWKKFDNDLSSPKGWTFYHLQGSFSDLLETCLEHSNGSSVHCFDQF